jgi:hypothetical protein
MASEMLMNSCGLVTGATPPVITFSRGLTSAARNGAGDVQLVLDRAIDANELIAIITPSSVGSIVRVVNTSDTSKQILFLAHGGGAQDTTFYFAFLQAAFGGH